MLGCASSLNLTKEPGASSNTLNLPFIGLRAATMVLSKPLIHACQSFHHEPSCCVAPANQSSFGRIFLHVVGPIAILVCVDNYVDAAALKSDDSIEALLAHPQTFWVVVDTINLVKARLPIRALPLPGQFICATEPELLVAGTGPHLGILEGLPSR